MPKRYRNKITKEELERGIIPFNHILVEMPRPSAEGMTSKSGIIVGFLEDDTFAEGDDSHTANMAQVYGIVYRCPDRLYFNKDDESGMSWDCDMELQEGDMVWFSILESKNSAEIECEDKIYKLIPYQDCYVAKREIWVDKWSVPQKKKTIVIPLNGYVLCSPVMLNPLSSFDTISEDIIDPTKGKIAYIGNPVRKYMRENYSHIDDLRVGDVVMFEAKTPICWLERKAYMAQFNGNNLYITVQRRRIVMTLNR